MPNILDRNGLQTDTLQEATAKISEAMKAIYGQDIVIDSNSPDGQWLNIIAQLNVNQLELITDIYNARTIAGAQGIQLDQLGGIVGIQRNGATYTLVNVDVTFMRSTGAGTTQTVNLVGLDENYNTTHSDTAFTVSDRNGNMFYLISSQQVVLDDETPLKTLRYGFRAKNLGKVSVTAGTINTIVTILAGVHGVINPSVPFFDGYDEESDGMLRARMQGSVGIRGSASGDAMRSRILEIQGVSEAKIYENYYDFSVDGIPPHSVWIIVYVPSQTGVFDDAIAQAIYDTKTLGAGYKRDVVDGKIVKVIFTTSGIGQEVIFYHGTPVELSLQIIISRYQNNTVFDLEAMKNYIVANLTYKLGQTAQSAEVITVVTQFLLSQGLNERGYCKSALLSTGNSPTPQQTQKCERNEIFAILLPNIHIEYET